MKRELKSNYARVDTLMGEICLYEKEPQTDLSNFALKGVTIKFNGDYSIEVTGERIYWTCLIRGGAFVEDLKNPPDEKYITLRYKSLSDFFKGIKKPYVKSGWYKQKNTRPYHCITSKWIIVL